MNTQYVSTRVINDYKPLRDKYKKLKGQVKDIPPEAFVLFCQLFHDKKINNLQFKTILQEEMKELNK